MVSSSDILNATVLVVDDQEANVRVLAYARRRLFFHHVYDGSCS